MQKVQGGYFTLPRDLDRSESAQKRKDLQKMRRRQDKITRTHSNLRLGLYAHASRAGNAKRLRKTDSMETISFLYPFGREILMIRLISNICAIPVTVLNKMIIIVRFTSSTLAHSVPQSLAYRMLILFCNLHEAHNCEHQTNCSEN